MWMVCGSLAAMLKLALRLPRPRLSLRNARRGGVVFATGLLLAFILYTFVGTNSHAVIEGRVYRSAQLRGETLARYLQSHHIRTVINLRGHCDGFPWYMAESEAITAAGASQEDITFSANRLPAPSELHRLIAVLDGTEYPILFHCKQGADRTGLASTMVLLLYTDATLSQARRELWPHRGHFPVARTLAMDDFFDRYAAWLSANSQEHTPARFRDWCLQHYKPGPAVGEFAWVTPVPTTIPAAKPFALTLRGTNRSDEPWQFTAGATSGLHLVYRLYDASGQSVLEDAAGLVRRTVSPGESIDFLLAFPKLPPGTYTLRAEMADFTGAALPVRAQYFFQFGCDAVMATIVVK